MGRSNKDKRLAKMRDKMLQERGAILVKAPWKSEVYVPGSTDGLSPMMKLVELQLGRKLQELLDLKHGSSRQIAAYLAEQGITIDHVTVYRWRIKLGIAEPLVVPLADGLESMEMEEQNSQALG